MQITEKWLYGPEKFQRLLRNGPWPMDARDAEGDLGWVVQTPIKPTQD